METIFAVLPQQSHQWKMMAFPFIESDKQIDSLKTNYLKFYVNNNIFSPPHPSYKLKT